MIVALGLAVLPGLARAAEADTNAPAPTEAVKAPAPEPAAARQNNVNVRGQAAINSEIVTHLQKGQVVTVLEEITLKKPKADEPAKWCRIQLPAGTPVWVHGDYIDPTNKTVLPRRLNVRGGASENHSILGRIEKGATVKVLEEKERWLKIEAPAVACGFVAAHLLQREAGAVAAVTRPPEAAPPADPAAAVTTVVEVPTNAPVVVAQPPAETNVVAVQTNLPAGPEATNAAPVATASTNVIEAAAPPAPELVKRVVTREGMLKGTFSIQAPTYFELRSMDNYRVINYVWSPSTNFTLKTFKGRHVLLTGEELLDERWPNTPVISVEQINLAP